MKKILSFALVLVLVLSLGTVAFATSGGTEPETPSETSTPTYTDMTTATFKVKFTNTNAGAHPAEVFTFSDFTFEGVKDAGVNSSGVVITTGPAITKIADVSIAAGSNEGTATITLPTFDAVGVYTYSFNQAVGTTAGVTYYKNDAVQKMMLVVTVVEENGLKRIAAVHVTEDATAGTAGQGNKTGEIENTYESGTLEVSKAVKGNLGDKSKKFKIKVTFEPNISGETIKSAITYTGAVSGTVENNTITLELKDTDKVTFANVPANAKYTVVELDADDGDKALAEGAKSKDGYEVSYSKATGTMTANGEEACTVTNTKEVTVDTGITLDSLPYILIVAVVLGAAVVMIVNKRRSEV